MGTLRPEVPHGTLDLMVLTTLATVGSLHGYAIARRIEQVVGDELVLKQGTIYPALLRLEQNGWIKGHWGISEHNRRARFYTITRTGRTRWAAEVDNWTRSVAMVGRLLESRP